MPFFKKDIAEKEPDETEGGGYGEMLSANPGTAGFANVNTPPQQTGAPSGATQTGYLNFDSLYGANEGVAKREAGRVNKGVNDAATASQNALAAQAGQFTQAVQKGSVQGPSAQQQAASKVNKQDAHLQGEAQTNLDAEDYDDGSPVPDTQGAPMTSYAAALNKPIPMQGPKPAMGAPTAASPMAASPLFATVPKPQPMLEGKPDVLASGKPGQPAPAPKELKVAGLTPTATTTADASPASPAALDPNSPDFWKQQAGASYSGPNSLQDMAGYADLLQGATHADAQLGALNGLGGDGRGQELDAGVKALLGTGASTGDAALIGAAGRPDFAKTNQNFGTGDFLKGGLRGQVGLSQQEADKARASSTAAAQGYGDMLSDYDKAQGNGKYGPAMETETYAPEAKAINEGISPNDEMIGPGIQKELGMSGDELSALWGSMTTEERNEYWRLGDDSTAGMAGDPKAVKRKAEYLASIAAKKGKK